MYNAGNSTLSVTINSEDNHIMYIKETEHYGRHKSTHRGGIPHLHFKRRAASCRRFTEECNALELLANLVPIVKQKTKKKHGCQKFELRGRIPDAIYFKIQNVCAESDVCSYMKITNRAKDKEPDERHKNSAVDVTAGHALREAGM